MPPILDARIPVRFARCAEGAGESAWLAQDGVAVPGGVPVVWFRLPPSSLGNPWGCACCVPRGPVAEALGRLFLARARGEMAFFRNVRVVTRDAAGEAAVRDALAHDPVLSARYRLVGS